MRHSRELVQCSAPISFCWSTHLPLPLAFKMQDSRLSERGRGIVEEGRVVGWSVSNTSSGLFCFAPFFVCAPFLSCVQEWVALLSIGFPHAVPVLTAQVAVWSHLAHWCITTSAISTSSSVGSIRAMPCGQHSSGAKHHLPSYEVSLMPWQRSTAPFHCYCPHFLFCFFFLFLSEEVATDVLLGREGECT